MYKTILLTGAGSGFGEGTAIGLARQGHDVIAAAQSWPQVTALRKEVDFGSSLACVSRSWIYSILMTSLVR